MYYKTLNSDGTTIYGYGKYDIPGDDQSEVWQPEITEKLVACQNGYHLCREEDLVYHLSAVICPVDVGPNLVVSDHKVITNTFRLHVPVPTWNERTQRLFACDCAEYALNLVGDKADPRSIEAVRVARLLAVGQATKEEIAAADAAYAAVAAAYAAYAAAASAYAAAYADAAYAAAAATYADAAAAAAYAAAAAAAAAYAAAAYADADATRRWQTERLMYYLNGEKNDSD